jgi:predicted ATP-dependent serine protease
VSPLKHEDSSTNLLELSGLVHISGQSGTGKTLLAVALAADTARQSFVDWINTDGKLSFTSYLRKNIDEDRAKRISIHNPLGFRKSYDAIMNLQIKDDSLVVIDTITRLLDMSSNSHELWGRELIEEILPTLAAHAQSKNATILLLNESRYRTDDELEPVFRIMIDRWVDHHLELKREYLSKKSTIHLFDDEDEIAYLLLDKEGMIEIKLQKEGDQCLENCSALLNT